jgi:hypothetical protein
MSQNLTTEAYAARLSMALAAKGWPTIMIAQGDPAGFYDVQERICLTTTGGPDVAGLEFVVQPGTMTVPVVAPKGFDGNGQVDACVTLFEGQAAQAKRYGITAAQYTARINNGNTDAPAPGEVA